ncbi:putative acetyl-CoA carboxylase, biotin carboxylase subunit [Bacteriovorax sp. BSW11_IV]|uniref:acetyl-CoA carboxylase biotin carboxylase subunit n=1 Tax=Bacteriovorax sp. BSW11_IV TaxID=1353529 RepID=UPI000389F074|nr:biotin carboxylase N-terminal domain-containing protein [Bacteriovorax sp. BSW11_IV]EQC50263.1 putative acetyl-CoA carboxylase, biotin carboxylase subunit [Bacteriovorax sp. BSW11_IV]
MSTIKKILIANRGEIALRVMKTCREMGIASVSLYTDKEVDYPHAYSATESYSLGDGPLSETYLNHAKIIALAKKCGADAIHPGYGFLSENGVFADKVRAEGIIFIGPSSDSMLIMGDKKTSKQKMEEVGVPLIPGYHGNEQAPSFLKDEAKKIGYPVLIKASAGGGGKGMRVVRSEAEFIDGLEAAKREAMNAFGDDTVLVEKYITNPRHIEVQVMSDRHGNHLHLFERECSIQRRHQKIVEETPSTALDEKTRQDITASAVAITTAINYEGAGTVEFILDEDGKFYFLEMNTRLQVEHPVTEMVTGLDLVKMQIEVARGDKLLITQDEIVQKGHAIEVRLYSEDPDNGFLPATGKISVVGHPTLNGTRLDSGYVDGNEVTINFDPMLAKLIAWGENREVATQKILASLCDVAFLGVKTNRDYLRRILETEEFKVGNTYTHFVETYKDKLLKREVSSDEEALAIATFLLESRKGKAGTIGTGPWSELHGFRNC